MYEFTYVCMYSTYNIPVKFLCVFMYLQCSYSFLKEHSESKELTQKLDEPKKEADDKIDESGQDTGKEADQE